MTKTPETAEPAGDAPVRDATWNGPGAAPHAYAPDMMAMGDCAVCGHTYEEHRAAVDGDREAGGAAREAIAEFDQRRRDEAQPAEPVEAEPVMWRVKGYGDAWWFIHTKAEAEHSASNGNLVQPLYLAPPSAGPVTIKAMEWYATEAWAGESVCADSVLGMYVAWRYGARTSYWTPPGYGPGPGTRVDGPLSVAQAAAQADFEARIRSAIVAQPAVATAACYDSRAALASSKREG